MDAIANVELWYMPSKYTNRNYLPELTASLQGTLLLVPFPLKRRQPLYKGHTFMSFPIAIRDKNISNMSFIRGSTVINPQRACARVITVSCVCQSVYLLQLFQDQRRHERLNSSLNDVQTLFSSVDILDKGLIPQQWQVVTCCKAAMHAML